MLRLRVFVLRGACLSYSPVDDIEQVPTRASCAVLQAVRLLPTSLRVKAALASHRGSASDASHPRMRSSFAATALVVLALLALAAAQSILSCNQGQASYATCAPTPAPDAFACAAPLPSPPPLTRHCCPPIFKCNLAFPPEAKCLRKQWIHLSIAS